MDNLNSWLGFFDVLGPWGRYVAGFLLFLLVVLAVFGAFTPFVQRNRRWLSLILGGGPGHPRWVLDLWLVRPVLERDRQPTRTRRTSRPWHGCSPA